MPFSDVLGQETAVSIVRRSLARSRLHHALLFHGPPGVGKERTALALACALACPHSTFGPSRAETPLLAREAAPATSTATVRDACGTCAACHRVSTLSSDAPHVPLHPDVLLVGRGLYPKEVLGRTTDEKTEISVDQIRRVVLERVLVGPHEARELVVIVRDCDEMSTGAANALLKTLEEPPSRTRFVLLTSRPGDLLTTIRSRTQPVRFAPLPDAIVTRLLIGQGTDPQLAERIAPLSAGSLELARTLADPDEAERRARALESLQKAADGTLVDLLGVSGELPNATEARERLAADLEAFVVAQAQIIRAAVASGGRDHEIDRALQRHEAAQRLRAMLARNANVPLALESTWLRLLAG